MRARSRMVAGLQALLVTERELVLMAKEKTPAWSLGMEHAKSGGIITYFPLVRLSDYHFSHLGLFSALALPESERWDPVPGSTGSHTADSFGEDEGSEGQSERVQLYQEGVNEAEHDQMLQAARAAQESDEMPASTCRTPPFSKQIQDLGPALPSGLRACWSKPVPLWVRPCDLNPVVRSQRQPAVGNASRPVLAYRNIAAIHLKRYDALVPVEVRWDSGQHATPR